MATDPALILILTLRIVASLIEQYPEIAKIIEKNPDILINSLFPTPKKDITG